MDLKNWLNAQVIKKCCKDGAYIINGYDDAIIGVSDSRIPIYDYYKLVEVAAMRYGMEMDVAEEYIEARVIRTLPEDKSIGPVINYGFRNNTAGSDMSVEGASAAHESAVQA